MPMAALDSPHLNKNAVATYLNVSERTVDRLRASGDLGYSRVRGQVRFSLHDVVRFLAKNEVVASLGQPKSRVVEGAVR